MFESFSYASFLNCFRRAPDHDFVVIAVHVDKLEGSSCWLVLISAFPILPWHFQDVPPELSRLIR